MVVRAREQLGRSARLSDDDEIGSRSTLCVVDPAHMPPQPVRLVLEPASPYRVTCRVGGMSRLELVDRAGLIVGRSLGVPVLRGEAVPGLYEARALNSTGALLRSVAIDWTGGVGDVSVD